MKRWKLLSNFLIQNFSINLLVMIQLALSLFLMNFCIGSYNKSAYFLNFGKKLENAPTLYHSYYTHTDTEPDVGEYSSISRVLFANMKLVNNRAITPTESQPEIYLDILAYDDAFFSGIGYDIKKGARSLARLSDCEEIPVWVSYECPGLSIRDVVEVEDAGGHIRKLRIVGVCRYNYTFQMTSAGDLSFRSFFKQGSAEALPALIARQSDLDHMPLYKNYQNGALITYSTQEAMLSAADKLRDSGSVNTIGDMLRLEKENVGKAMVALVPLLCTALGISVIGVIGVSLLHTWKNLKTFAIYYLNGAAWKDCLWIVVGYLALLLVLAVLINAAAYPFVETAMVLRANNAVFSGGFVLISLLVPSILPLRIFRRKTPVQILRSIVG